MRAAGRLVGVLSASAVIALWATFQFWNPYSGDSNNLTLLLTVTMIIAAFIAAVAAAQGKHVAMYLLFFVMFVPLGGYMWLTPGVFSAIGWFELAYLGGAALVHRDILTSKRKRAG